MKSTIRWRLASLAVLALACFTLAVAGPLGPFPLLAALTLLALAGAGVRATHPIWTGRRR